MATTLPISSDLPLVPDIQDKNQLDLTESLMRKAAEPGPPGTLPDGEPIEAAPSPLIPESGPVDHALLATGQSAETATPSILGEDGGLTSSFDAIPQSTVIPEYVRHTFRNPEEDARMEEARKRNEIYWRQKQDLLEGASNQAAYYQKKGIDFSFAADPSAAMTNALAETYLVSLNGNEPLPDDPRARDVILARVLLTEFNIRGGGTNATLVEAMAAKHQRGKQREDIFNLIGEKGFVSQLAKSTNIGGKPPDTWASVREQFRAMPGYDPADEMAYHQAWYEVERNTREHFSATAPYIAETYRLMQQGGAGTFSEILKAGTIDEGAGFLSGIPNMIGEAMKKDAPAYARSIYHKLGEKEIPAYLEGLGILVRTRPKEEQATFWKNFAKQGGRDLDDLGRNIVDSLYQGALSASAMPLTTAGPMGPGVQLNSTREANAQVKAFGDARDLASDVRRLEREDFDGVKKLWGNGFLGDVEEGLYAMPGALATTAMAMIPYGGPLLTGLSLQASAYDDVRFRLIDQKVPRAQAAEIAGPLSVSIAGIQYLPERFGLKLITRRIPGAEKLFDKIGDKITNRALRGLTTGMIIGAAETGTEYIQKITVPLVQEIANDFNDVIPQVSWKQEFAGFWSDNLTTFVATLPLAFFGAVGGLNRDARHKAFAEASTTQRLAYGITPEHSAAIDAAMTQGPSSLSTAVELALEHRDPRSESARTAVEELERTARAEKEATEWLQMYGFLPRAERGADGKWTLYDTRSNEIIGTATNAEEAARMASTHAKLDEEQHADQIARITTSYQAAEATGQWAAENGRNQTTELDLSGKFTVEGDSRMTTHARNRAAAQERVKGGDGSVTRLVFGQSTTETEDGLRKTVNRILGGGSILTVFHEDAHALRREAHKNGVLTREDDIAIIRAVDAVLDGKTVRNKKGIEQDSATRLSLLPENFDSLSQADQDVAIDEAISELMEAEIIRTRKGRGARQLPAGIVSRNMAAIARLAGPKAANKFGSFIEAFRSYFGLATDRAHHIRRGLADGSLDQAGYDAYFAKFTGKVKADGKPVSNQPVALDPVKVAEFIGEEVDVSFGDSAASGTSFSVGPPPSLIRPLDSSTHPQQNTHDERLREPIQILEALRAEAQDLGQGGIRTNAGKRRKHGKEFSGDSGLLAWAQRNGRILESGPIQSVGDEDAPGGGEHKVIYDEDSQRVIKLTKPGLFGAQAEDALAYIERWALHNRAFRDDVAFEGLVTLPGEHAPRAVISQRYAEGRDATTEEQADFLNSKGFHEQADGRWIHPIRGITVWDTITPGNIIATPDGMRVIDLQVATTPSKELAQVREQTGIGRETSFSIGTNPSSSDSEARINEATVEARKKVAAADAESIKRAGRFWLSLHGEKGAARLPELRGKTMEDLVKEANAVIPGLTTYPFGKLGDADATVIEDGVGIAFISVGPEGVWVNTTSSGGTDTYGSPGMHENRVKASMSPAVYQIAQAYAKNNGLKFIPDPAGVSTIATFRRWPQLLSSAIRMGDTSHLDGTKDVEGWKDGDHEHNAGLLALHEYEQVRHLFPEIDGLHLSKDSSTIIDHAGAPVSRTTLADLLVGERHPKRLGIGETTLRRAIVTGQVAAEGRLESGSEAGRRPDGERRIHPGAVENFAPDLGSGDEGVNPPKHALDGISYSIGSSPPNPTGNPYRNTDGRLPTTPYHRSASDPDLAEKEATFNGILNAPPEEADEAYNSIPETRGGKVIGTDLAREVLPEYRTSEGRTRYTGITTSTASQYSKDRLWREIHDRKNREFLLFTAGGPASGKSTVVNHKLIEEHDLIYDGTLRDAQWATRNLEAAEAHGWKAAIVWVGRPLKLAAIGAVERSISEGRPFALADLPDAHYTAQQTAIALAKHFKGKSAIDFQFYLNEGTTRDVPAKELTLEQIDTGGEYSYDNNHGPERRGEMGGEKTGHPQSGLERFRATTREDIVGVFRDAVEGRITVEGNRASHEILVQLAGKDEELQRILKESAR